MDKNETQLFIHQTSYKIFGSWHVASLQSNVVCKTRLAVLLFSSQVCSRGVRGLEPYKI